MDISNLTLLREYLYRDLCLALSRYGFGPMSAIGPKRTFPYVAFDVAFRGKADGLHT
jgi:hypothetical protein